MDFVRDFCSVLLAIAAAVLLTLWAPSAWVQDTVVDTQGFLSVAEPLGSQQSFQDDVAATAVDGLLETVQIPTWAQSLVRPTLDSQAAALAHNQVFSTIWADSMGELHTTILDPAGGTVRADLNPYADNLVKPLGEKLGMTIDVPDTDLLTLTIVDVPASAWPQRLVTFAGMHAWLPWAGIACAVLAVLVAAHRGAMTFLMGLAVLIGGAALMLATQGVSALVPDAIEQARLVGALVGAFEKRLGIDMFVPSMALIGSGAAAMVAGLTVIGVQSARRRQVR